MSEEIEDKGFVRIITEDDPNEMVCSECGGTNIQSLAWIQPNTKEFIYFSDGEYDDYCNDCNNDTGFITRREWDRKKLEEDDL